jgi:hypothetical protein
MTGWSVTNAVEGSLREAGTIIAVLDAVNKTINSDQPMYWVAPAPYLGNKVDKSHLSYFGWRLFCISSY